MLPYLNFHTHRRAAAPTERVIRDLSSVLAGGHDVPQPAEEWFSAGIHPLYIPACTEQALTELEKLWSLPGCAAVGEAGIDKNSPAPLPLQCEVFARQLEAARRHGLPVIVHCVRAWDELLMVCRSTAPDVPCVVHGFRGRPELAHQLLGKGFYLSFGTRFNPQSLTLCPADRLFLETDEDSCHAAQLYTTAAHLRGCTAETLNRQCMDNLQRISRPGLF